MGVRDDRLGILRRFAEDRSLQPGPAPGLPMEGSLLGRTRGFSIDAAAHGEIAPGRVGTVGMFSYEYESSDTTYTRRLTAVVTRVPESLGYLPYLSGGDFRSWIEIRPNQRRLKLENGEWVMVDGGADDGWLREVFSPALADWLARGPENFGFELIAGLLVVVRDGHHSNRELLGGLCADAERLAGALVRESVEEAATGGARRSAARKAQDRVGDLAAGLVPRLEPGPLPNVAAAISGYAPIVQRSTEVIRTALTQAFFWTIGISIVAGGIYGLLLTVGDPLTNVLIWELGLLGLLTFLNYRGLTRKVTERCSEEAFWAGFARERRLTAVEPLEFAATHAEASLPGTPVRAFSGSFGGRPGGLMFTGKGLERGDRAALTAGPSGPTATQPVEFSAPGASAAAVDELIELLVLDLQTTPG